jgi:PAS domain S-box-containing protein
MSEGRSRGLHMSLTSRIYIGGVLAVGAAALGRGFYLWNPQDLARFICFLALAVAGSCLKVRLPGVNTGTMSVLFVFLLAGIVELDLPETLVIGVACVTVQSFWHAQKRPRAIQVLFSIANIAFAIAATDLVYRAVPSLQAPIRRALAASVFFVTNTFPVATAIALTEEKSLRQVWSSCYLWCFPYYLVGAAIVEGFSFVSRTFDWQASLLITPVVYVIYRSYRLYLDKLRTVKEHAEEERRHSEEVAILHARAMESLASAMSANARLDAVIRSTPLAILSLDREGNVTSWNAAAEHIFGWSPEEAVGRPLPFAIGNSEEIIQGIIERTLRGELIAGEEMTQRRKDDSPFEATIWTAPLQDRSDEISGILVTVADISDRKRLEEQLRLSQKMEAVGRLAGGIAHDFNNLLTVINGYSSMLVASMKGNAYAASRAEEILAAGTRAAELVSQLLTFSRRQVIKPQPLDINEFVRDVERMLRRIIGEHIELRTVLAPDAGWIHADFNQMEGVLLNLATNARDAMPDGGGLTVETAHFEVLPDQQSPYPDLAPGSFVRLVVTDTGRGMDSYTQQHLFEPFFTTKEKGKGTGLGLSSVYGCVEQNHGRIFVASEPGRGAAFSIYLPRIEPPQSAAAPKTAAPGFQKGTETVLLVEDESAVRRMLREALCNAGYRVWEAGNGADAVMQWGSFIEEIDLVVTDVVMPVMNGLRLATELQARRPGLNVVFMSGHSEDVINGQSGVSSAPYILQKPFVPDVLVCRVREILDQRGGRVSGSPASTPVEHMNPPRFLQ